jgi:hypothetical protein
MKNSDIYTINTKNQSNVIAKENENKGKHKACEIEKRAKEISTKDLKMFSNQDQNSEFSYYKDYGMHTSDKRYFTLSKVENEIIITQVDDKKEYKVHIHKEVWNLIVKDVKGELEEECENRCDIKNSITGFPSLKDIKDLNSPIYIHKIIGQALIVLFWGLEKAEWNPNSSEDDSGEKHLDQVRCIKRACLVWMNLLPLKKQEFYYWCDTNQADKAFADTGVRVAIRCFLFFYKDTVKCI